MQKYAVYKTVFRGDTVIGLECVKKLSAGSLKYAIELAKRAGFSAPIVAPVRR